MDASGGQRGVSYGSPPIKSCRRIHSETDPQVWWSLPGRKFRLSGNLQNKPHTNKERATIHVSELKQKVQKTSELPANTAED